MKTHIFSFFVALILINSTFAHAKVDGGSVTYKALMSKADQKINEQKFQEALDVLKAEAGSLKDPMDQARLLTKIAQIEIGLHDYETAVKNFRSAKWPADSRAQTLLSLFNAYTLQYYSNAYSWEIRKREKVADSESKDLKTWTMEEIFFEANRSLQSLWSKRQTFGSLPKTELEDFITPNNYPKDVRATFRDTYTHLYASILNNSAGWSPEQSNQIYLLNLSNLLEGKFAPSFDLSSNRFHPLEKLAFLFHDLKSWHQQNKNFDSALDAHLELYKILYARMSHESDKDSIRLHLEKTLLKNETTPWYSYGMGVLAEFWEKHTAPDALVKARNLALKGAAKFPSSFGAKLCKDIIKRVEAPAFTLAGMQVDGLGRRSLGLSFKNLEKVYFHSFRWDIRKSVAQSSEGSINPTWQQIQELPAKKPDRAWSVDLAKTPDYRQHNHFVTPPKHEKGVYIIVASMKPHLQPDGNLIQGVLTTFGDIVLNHRGINGGTEFEVYDGNSGQTLKNVSIEIYKLTYGKGNTKVTTVTTDNSGRAVFKVSPDQGYSQFVAIAESKGSLAHQSFSASAHYHIPGSEPKALVYTDRSIYRPEQKIQWKIIFYESLGGAGKFKVRPKAEEEVSLYDLNGEIVETKKVTSDEFGSAWGEFVIPKGRTLGAWSVRNRYGQTGIRVEEYKRPTFELTWKPQVKPLKLNKPAEIIGEAKYLFGAPLTAGKVRYTVQRQIIFPWWCFWGWWDFSSYQSPEVIESSETVIGEDGSFAIKFLAKADTRFQKGVSDLKFNYLVNAEVTDEGGETRTSQTNVTLGVKSAEAFFNQSNAFFLEGKEASVDLRRVLLTGAPAPGKGEWTLEKLKEPDSTQMPAEFKTPKFLKALQPPGLVIADDGKQNRWNPGYNWQAVIRDWGVEKKIKSAPVVTDAKGEAKISLPSLGVGTYRLTYRSKDTFGMAFETQTEFFVANSKYRPALPALLLLSQTSAKVGEDVYLWVPTGLSNQDLVLEVFQDGKIIETKAINTSKDSALIKWPIKESMRGGLGFTLRLIRDYQDIHLEQALFVPWDNKVVDVEFASFREKLRPGQKETWTIKLKGPNKTKLDKASVQLLAYMYDRSLDQLSPHNSTSIIGLYPTRSATYAPQVGLGPASGIHLQYSFYVANEFVYPRVDSPRFYPNYGIGGPGRRGGRSLHKRMQVADEREAVGEADMMAMADKVYPASAPPAKMAENSAAKAKKEDASSEAGKQPEPVRSNFAETAFFLPNLINSADGSIDISFQIPDSVTSWTLWLQGLTKDLMSATATKQVQTVKELMIRPYLPRFLREGDQAEIRFVLNNTSNKAITGTIDIDLLEEDQKTNAAPRFKVDTKLLRGKAFTIAANKSFVHKIQLHTPAGLGSLVVRATAKAGAHSDGELRVLPVLPGRFHLAQSKFVTLKDKSKKILNFKDLADKSDSTRIDERLTVQVDAQLFYSVLTSLPYLYNYPYESTELILNRFVSTGIMTSIYSKFPAIEKMAKEMSARPTQLESFNQPDPNRQMAFEETPWLMESKGGATPEKDLINVLDSRVAKKFRSESLKQLEKMQTPVGGFPWFSGGPPSPDLTLYALYGFSKALEFGVDVPKPMVQKAWSYLHKHYITNVVSQCMAHDSCWEFITFVNYVLSNYPDTTWGNDIFTVSDRKTMLDFSFKHWKKHSPYLKGYLSLTLNRSSRSQDAKLVWDSVMDSAKFNEDEGTHWAREDRSWLWYNDTIETQAFALRTLMELNSDNTKRDGLVQWIFLNKKLNHWKSTRATAEVIYSLAHYLTKTNQMGQREAVSVQVGKEKTVNMEFLPDQYSGKKNQIVFEGAKVNANLMPITVEKSTPGFMFASANWQFSTEQLPKEAVGDFMNVTRKYFLRDKSKKQVILKPIANGAKIEVGDEVEVHLSLKSKHPVGYVHLRDPRGAGFEPVDTTSKYKWNLGLGWYEEIRDSATNFFFEQLPQGEYTFKYRVRAANAGDFKLSPATVQPLYAPEFAAYSTGLRLHVK